ncbi:MAG: DapH/DapD/GlmU-related protein [bacterium]|nr:DapH/DapD/GlmU-related protein [bacterium]
MSKEYEYEQLGSVGEDVFISKNVEIRRPTNFLVGNHVAIDTGFYITTEAEIGDYIHIGPYVCVIGGGQARLVLGNFINIGVGSKLLCGSDTFLGEGLVTAPGIPVEYTKVKREPIIIENFANIGANSVIMPGITIAEGSVIGAGSVVTKNTEPWTIYVGVPAKPIKKRPKEKMLEYAKLLGY